MAPILLPLLLAVCASAAEPSVNPAKLRASREIIAETMIPIHELTDQSYQGMQWSLVNAADFGPVLTAASAAVKKLHEQYPSATADAYGNGMMTNIEDTARLFGNGKLERGCISHQSITFDAIKPLLTNSSLTVKKIRVGLLLQHNAVIVYPTGKAWRHSGVIFDAWQRQKSDLHRMVYTFKSWTTFGDRARLLNDDE